MTADAHVTPYQAAKGARVTHRPRHPDATARPRSSEVGTDGSDRPLHGIVGSNGKLVYAGALAYTFGLRHAFDADQISAVDDATRYLLQKGKRPLAVGFFFSLGHSTVVFAFVTALALVVSKAKSFQRSFQGTGGIIGTLVSGGFLYFIAALNLAVLVGIIRMWRLAKRGCAGSASSTPAGQAGHSRRRFRCRGGSAAGRGALPPAAGPAQVRRRDPVGTHRCPAATCRCGERDRRLPSPPVAVTIRGAEGAVTGATTAHTGPAAPLTAATGSPSRLLPRSHTGCRTGVSRPTRCRQSSCVEYR